MKKYIPYLLKFAFMIFAIFPAIKHEWLAISMGVIALQYLWFALSGAGFPIV